MNKLTPKQQTFVNEYLIDLNATQAAIRAGYSQRTASRIGPQLLVKTCVSKAIQKAQEARARKTKRTAEDVLRDIQEWTREAHDNGDLKTAFKGLELEGKHLGMFKERIDLISSDGSMSPRSMEERARKAIEDLRRIKQSNIKMADSNRELDDA